MPTPPPVGLPPAIGLAFDDVTIVWTITALVMLAGLALLLWALRARDRVTYRLTCPKHGTQAIVDVRCIHLEGKLEVERCSLLKPPRLVTCGRECLRLVA